MTKQRNEIVPPPPNPIGRPKGSRNKRTVIRAALADTFENGEVGFFKAIAQQAKDGDMQAANLLANRLYPQLKPESATIALPEPLTGTSADMARQLIQFAGNGDIPTSTATELLQALANVVKIEEATDLMERIAKLEELSQ